MLCFDYTWWYCLLLPSNRGLSCSFFFIIHFIIAAYLGKPNLDTNICKTAFKMSQKSWSWWCMLESGRLEKEIGPNLRPTSWISIPTVSDIYPYKELLIEVQAITKEFRKWSYFIETLWKSNKLCFQKEHHKLESANMLMTSLISIITSTRNFLVATWGESFWAQLSEMHCIWDRP